MSKNILATARIIEDSAYLSTSRTSEIKKLLKSIVTKGIHVNATPIRGSYVFGVSNTKENGTDFTEWRFSTKLKIFLGSYYEIWNTHNKQYYFLDKVYFHLYKKKSIDYTYEEFVLLHCDASEPDSSEHAKYKKSPHLHIHVEGSPIAKAHIALNNGDLDNILKSTSNLQDAMKQAVDMIENQIFPLYS